MLFPPLPLLLVLPPVPLVGLFAPLASIVGFPARRCIPAPLSPGRRGRRVIANGDLENRCGNMRGRDNDPRAAPGRSDVPAPVGKGPVLMSVKEDVGLRPRSIVDGHSRDDHESWWPRELNADVDPYLRLGRGQ